MGAVYKQEGSEIIQDGELYINDILIEMEVEAAIEGLRHEKLIALDIETGGLKHYRDPTALIQLYAESGVAYALHVRGAVPTNLVSFLSEPGRLFIGHNIFGFDLKFLYSAGVDIFGPQYYDTMVAEIILNVQNRRNVSVSLQNTVDRRLGKNLKKDAGEHRWMEPVLTVKQLTYAIEDVTEIIPLYRAQQSRIESTGQHGAIDQEMYIGPCYALMACNGLPVDPDRLAAYLEHQRTEAAKAQSELFEVAGNINLNSPKQVKEFFSKNGIELSNTRAETLEELAQSPGPGQRLAEIIVNFRTAAKRLSVYSEMMSRFGGTRIYSHPITRAKVRHPATFGNTRQLGADTGRSTSQDPNLQQVPQDMRSVFGGVPGWVVLSRDYKSIEVVVAAAIAQDEALIEVLKHADSHTMVASLVFGIPPEQVTKTQRSLAKAMSFTLIFGGGARTLWIYAHRYGASITIEEAKGLITKFFSRFKGLAKMRSIAYRKAQEYNDQLAQGKWPMPITISLPQGLKRQLTQDKAAATVILNTSVQGSAAAGLKEAIRLLRDWNMHHYLAAVVHDEIIMIVPEELAPEYDKALDEAMVQGMIRMIGDAVPVVSSVALNDDGTYPTHWSK